MTSTYITKIIVIAATACVLPTVSLAAVPPVEKAGKAAITSCPDSAKTLVYHSDKIVFIIGASGLKATLAGDQPKLDALPRQTELDIKIQDKQNYVADIKAKVLDFLGAAIIPENLSNIQIRDVEYTAVVCPKTITVLPQ